MAEEDQNEPTDKEAKRKARAERRNKRQPLEVFYSWQSDIPHPLLKGALIQACERLKAKEYKVVVREAMEGVRGSPSIVDVVFQGIRNADMFVADVSVITKSENGRRVPNPNVTLELGYASAVLGADRIVLAFDMTTGTPESLPFDFNSNMLSTFDRSTMQADLANDLADHIEAVALMKRASLDPEWQTKAEVRRLFYKLHDELDMVLELLLAWFKILDEEEDTFGPPLKLPSYHLNSLRLASLLHPDDFDSFEALDVRIDMFNAHIARVPINYDLEERIEELQESLGVLLAGAETQDPAETPEPDTDAKDEQERIETLDEILTDLVRMEVTQIQRLTEDCISIMEDALEQPFPARGERYSRFGQHQWSWEDGELIEADAPD